MGGERAAVWPEPSQGSSWEQTAVINRCHGNDSMLSPVSLLVNHPTWDCLGDPRCLGAGWGVGVWIEHREASYHGSSSGPGEK